MVGVSSKWYQCWNRHKKEEDIKKINKLNLGSENDTATTTRVRVTARTLLLLLLAGTIVDTTSTVRHFRIIIITRSVWQQQCLLVDYFYYNNSNNTEKQARGEKNTRIQQLHVKNFSTPRSPSVWNINNTQIVLKAVVVWQPSETKQLGKPVRPNCVL